MTDEPRPATYADSGVDIGAGERAVELMRPWVEKASRPEVIGGIGGFAGLFELDLSRWRHPVLASSTDGVGTKLVIAQQLGRHDTIGLDLVGMVVDDVVVCGAEPLFLQDYIACGRVVPERMAEIIGGIARGCAQVGCALVGGETAEHPGLLEPDEYDIAGTAVGAVDRDALLGPVRVRVGDVVIAMGSSGLHSNGYSLVRHTLLGSAGRMPLDAIPEDLDTDRTLGEELLTPTRIYARDCLLLVAECEVHAFAHITGGGLAANLSRSLPVGLDAVVDRGSWRPAPVFELIAGRGRIEAEEMERTFNMGVGMIAVVAAQDADRALAVLMGRKMPAWVAGEVAAGRDVDGGGVARLTGRYAR
ncbi:MAG: phosphoribosylformylglycinamidine cyclo-ligase [Mycobacteriales bacterium]